MGGDGSGRYPRSESRTTVDQCRILDIDSLHRDGLLALDTSGTTTWFNDGKPRASIGHHRTATSGGKALLRLSYAIPGRGDEKPRGRLLRSAHVHQVQLRQLPPVVRLSRIGVWRARRQALQTPPAALFLCRHCHDLGYESSQKSGTPFYENVTRPLQAANAARAALRNGDDPFDPGRLKDCYEAR